MELEVATSKADVDALAGDVEEEAVALPFVSQGFGRGGKVLIFGRPSKSIVFQPCSTIAVPFKNQDFFLQIPLSFVDVVV